MGRAGGYKRLIDNRYEASASKKGSKILDKLRIETYYLLRLFTWLDSMPHVKHIST